MLHKYWKIDSKTQQGNLNDQTHTRERFIKTGKILMQILE